jgi:hypothetical protein
MKMNTKILAVGLVILLISGTVKAAGIGVAPKKPLPSIRVRRG